MAIADNNDLSPGEVPNRDDAAQETFEEVFDDLVRLYREVANGIKLPHERAIHQGFADWYDLIRNEYELTRKEQG